MAKFLMILLVCCPLAFLSQGKPIPPRLSLTKQTDAGSQPDQDLKDSTPSQEADESPVALDDCGEFCSQSYPEHTYPTPSHHKACVTGCHSAQVSALIAWPFKSSSDSCATACSEAYPGSSEQQYACVTGCNATTMDSLFPDREAVYTEVYNQSSSDTAMFDQATDLMNSLLDSFFSSFSLDSDMDRLTEYANQMSQLLPPVKSSMVTYIMENGDVFELMEYSYQSGIVVEDPTKTIFDLVEFPIDDIEVMDMSSNAAGIQSNSGGDKSSETLDSFYIYYSPSSRERCGWLTRKIMARQILLGLSLVLIGVGVMVCCLGVVKRDTSHVTGSKKRQPVVISSHAPSTVKVPLLGSSEYRPDNSHMMLPVHVKVGGAKTVEGVITVVA